MPRWTGAQDLETKQKALDAIARFAAETCNVVSTHGEADSMEVKGDVRAQLSGLAAKLADLGISGSGTIKNERYQNVLQSDLAAALKDNANCKLEVFKSLKNELLGAGSALPDARGRRSDIGGIWRDADDPNTVTRITQNGDRFEFTRVGALPGGLRYKSSGAGRIVGETYASEYLAEYQNGDTSTGHCSGALRAEGVLTANCTDTMLHEINTSATRQ